jgi:hypothetical protein
MGKFLLIDFVFRYLGKFLLIDFVFGYCIDGPLLLNDDVMIIPKDHGNKDKLGKEEVRGKVMQQ